MAEKLDVKSKEWTTFVQQEKYGIIRSSLRPLEETRKVCSDSPNAGSTKNGIFRRAIKYYVRDLPVSTFNKDTFENMLSTFQRIITGSIIKKVALGESVSIDNVRGWIEPVKDGMNLDVFLGECEEGDMKELEPLVQFVLVLILETWED